MMLHRISQFVERNYSPYVMLALLVLAAVFFWLFNFSVYISNPHLISLSGGEGLLDLKLFYTAQDAYISLGKYGEAGRGLYRHFLAADFLFAPCYGFGFSMLFTRLIRVLHQSASWQMRFNLLPLAIALADYMENIFIFSLLNIYPKNIPALGTLAGIFTLSKHLLIFVSLVFMLAGLLLLLARKIKSE